MTTAAAPEAPATPQYSLQNPPPGSSWDLAEVKGDHGQKSFGERPLLTWDESQAGVEGAIAFYTHEGVALILNGTSVRVTVQGIARRVTEKGLKQTPPWSDEQINNEIAKLSLEYRPGKRQAGQSTAASRAANAAKKAAGKISGDAVAQMIERVAAMTPEQRAAYAASLGMNASDFDIPSTASDNGEGEGEGESEGEGEQQG